MATKTKVTFQLEGGKVDHEYSTEPIKIENGILWMYKPISDPGITKIGIPIEKVWRISEFEEP